MLCCGGDEDLKLMHLAFTLTPVVFLGIVWIWVLRLSTEVLRRRGCPPVEHKAVREWQRELQREWQRVMEVSHFISKLSLFMYNAG